MVVEEMNILTTIFLRYDNLKIIIPNSVLATRAINNYYRSPDMGDGVEFCIHVKTPAEKIGLMKQRILRSVKTEQLFFLALLSFTRVCFDVDEHEGNVCLLVCIYEMY